MKPFMFATVVLAVPLKARGKCSGVRSWLNIPFLALRQCPQLAHLCCGRSGATTEIRRLNRGK